jgi:hypothetical protein
MTTWNKIKRDFKTAPMAAKPLGIANPAKVTQVISREEAGKAFSAGLARARSAH